MRFAFALPALAALTAASARVIPHIHDRGIVTNPQFTDGFQDLTPTPQQLQNIEEQAHGTLSNGPPPSSISPEGITALQLIALNERFESVFFAELLSNVTYNVTGYEVPWGIPRDYMIEFLNVVAKTEQLHTLNAEGALKHVNATVIQPCTSYNFPVSNLDEAILLAATFTSNVFGVLGDVASTFAATGDLPLVDKIAQTIASEAEQTGFFRFLLGRQPQELPFTTPSNQAFAFSALHSFIDASSCPNIDAINLTLYNSMSIVGTPKAQDSDITYVLDNSANVFSGSQEYFVVYNNQLNVPVVQNATVVGPIGSTVELSAWFPYSEHEMNGLTIVAVTNSSGPFKDINDVAKSTVWAPAFIYPN